MIRTHTWVDHLKAPIYTPYYLLSNNISTFSVSLKRLRGISSELWSCNLVLALLTSLSRKIILYDLFIFIYFCRGRDTAYIILFFRYIRIRESTFEDMDLSSSIMSVYLILMSYFITLFVTKVNSRSKLCDLYTMIINWSGYYYFCIQILKWYLEISANTSKK